MTAVHPRFRERRIGVARDAGRRRLHRLIAALCAVGCLLVAFLVVQSPILDVDDVKIAGAEHTTLDQVVAAAGLTGGEAILTLDVGAVRHEVEALPWVQDAAVTRDLPGTLRIRITERSADAVLVTKGGAFLIDADGRVLAAASDAERAGLLSVVANELPKPAPGATAAVPDGVVALAARLPAAVPGAVSEITVDGDGALSATLAGSGTVQLGDTTELDDKVVALTTVLQQVDLSCVRTIDLRVPTHPALVRAKTCE